MTGLQIVHSRPQLTMAEALRLALHWQELGDRADNNDTTRSVCRDQEMSWRHVAHVLERARQMNAD